MFLSLGKKISFWFVRFFFKLHFMQLFSADTTVFLNFFAHQNIKKMSNFSGWKYIALLCLHLGWELAYCAAYMTKAFSLILRVTKKMSHASLAELFWLAPYKDSDTRGWMTDYFRLSFYQLSRGMGNISWHLYITLLYFRRHIL